MFKKLLEILQEAFSKIFSKNEELYQNNRLIGDLPKINILTLVSPEMQAALDVWERMYIDSLLAEDTMSLGIPGIVCSELARSVLLEFESHIKDIDNLEFNFEKDEPVTKAQFLEKIYQLKVIQKLRENLEYGMAMGGMVIKPYINGGSIYIDFCCQGKFVPLGFDDDGNIIDIAFYDRFVAGNSLYTKIERHYFNSGNKTVTVINAGFVLKNTDINIDASELGIKIPLADVPIWQNISEEPIIINNVDRPLYGYYKVPKKNTVDLKSPLGASVFSRAEKIIEYTNQQFGRLDFEYLGGSMAIDVDEGLLDTSSQIKRHIDLPEGRRRVFRALDSPDGELYKIFAPGLRDSSYIQGLSTYLMRVEDLTELSRGTLSDPNVEARTATEMLILKQRAYSNIADNQKSLEKALKNLIYALNVYADLYSLSKPGDFNVTFDWDDSVITDRTTQLEERLMLVENGILSKAEVRAWYTGENLEEAKKNIEEIEDGTKALDDIFTAPSMPNEGLIANGSKGQTDESVVD